MDKLLVCWSDNSFRIDRSFLPAKWVNRYMKFKNWLIQSESDGGAATSIMHGGLQDMPTARLNLNLPVQSKISTKDGSDKIPLDPFEVGDWKKPDKLFKFSPQDKVNSAERDSQWIDKSRRRARFVTIPPDTIY